MHHLPWRTGLETRFSLCRALQAVAQGQADSLNGWQFNDNPLTRFTIRPSEQSVHLAGKLAGIC